MRKRELQRRFRQWLLAPVDVGGCQVNNSTEWSVAGAMCDECAAGKFDAKGTHKGLLSC